MDIINNIIILIIKSSALLSSAAISSTIISSRFGKVPGNRNKEVMIGFVILFLISSSVYLVIL